MAKNNKFVFIIQQQYGLYFRNNILNTILTAKK